MKIIKRIVAGVIIFLLVVAVTFVIVVGPWPTYKDSRYKESAYFPKALADISACVQQCEKTDNPQPLRVGWARRIITPEIGTPMGGYSGRPKGKRSEGVRDDLYVRPVAFSDGKDTVVLISADILITHPDLAERVRKGVAEQVPDLTPQKIVFNATHTHCGPGSFSNDAASIFSGGKFDPKVPAFIAKQYVEAIVEAYRNMKPAKLAYGSVDVPQYIRNRVRRNAPVDPELRYFVVEQEGGKRLYGVCYSAHPTIFGEDMMLFSAEYPGECMRYIERNTRADAAFFGGAVGAMGPNAPEGSTEEERVVAMGTALGQIVLENTQNLTFHDRLDILTVGTKIGMPPFQLRPFENNPNWRISPILPKILLPPLDGWISAAKIGDLLFVGMAFDFCGEESILWDAYAKDHGLEFWPLSFCGTYCGYFTPDKYYLDLPLNYETGLMSWFGPNVEAYFTDLFHHIVAEFTAPPTTKSALSDMSYPRTVTSAAAGSYMVESSSYERPRN
jgi:hypothetical protein